MLSWEETSSRLMWKKRAAHQYSDDLKVNWIKNQEKDQPDNIRHICKSKILFYFLDKKVDCEIKVSPLSRSEDTSFPPLYYFFSCQRLRSNPRCQKGSGQHQRMSRAPLLALDEECRQQPLTAERSHLGEKFCLPTLSTLHKMLLRRKGRHFQIVRLGNMNI